MPDHFVSNKSDEASKGIYSVIRGFKVFLHQSIFPDEFAAVNIGQHNNDLPDNWLCNIPFMVCVAHSKQRRLLLNLQMYLCNFRLVNSDMSEETAKNVVRQLIDSYNRYSGFCALCFIVITSTANQRKIVTVIRNIEEIDEIFEEKLNTTVDNHRWRRYASMELCIYEFVFPIYE